VVWTFKEGAGPRGVKEEYEPGEEVEGAVGMGEAGGGIPCLYPLDWPAFHPLTTASVARAPEDEDEAPVFWVLGTGKCDRAAVELAGRWGKEEDEGEDREVEEGLGDL